MKVFFLGLVMIVMHAQSAIAQQPLSEGSVERISASVDFSSKTDHAPGDVTRWVHREERLGARYLRLHFAEVEDLSTVDYSVILRDRTGRVIEKFSKESFRSTAMIWSKIVLGDLVRVEVIANEQPLGLRFRIDKIVVQRNMGSKFSISLPDEREAVAEFTSVPALYERSRAVAKLTFVRDELSKSCTGFLIDDNRFITNEHCINSQEICNSAIATFGFEFDADGSLKSGEQFSCEKFVDASHVLDVALITLQGLPGSTWGKIPFSTGEPSLGAQLYMVQHPAGEPKQISRKDCAVTTWKADGYGHDTDFGHKCDTLDGSSGSPMLDSKFELVGLHHFGFLQVGPWKDENRAVHVPQIKHWLSSH